MSPGTRLEVDAFWEYAAFVVNSMGFLLVGIEAAYVQWWRHLPQVLGAILAVLVGRAAIYPLTWVVNGLRGGVPFAWQHILFWGGLRGALSMALVLGLPRGGVPVAFEVATALRAPLDVFVVRKLGVPWQEELAMGALASGGLRAHCRRNSSRRRVRTGRCSRVG